MPPICPPLKAEYAASTGQAFIAANTCGGSSGTALVVMLVIALAACRTHVVSPLGVLRDSLGVKVESVGPAPRDISATGFVSFSDDRRVRRADLVGSDAQEMLLEIRPGRNAPRGGVEVLDETQRVVKRITTDEYLTDFGAVQRDSDSKSDAVIYTYPTSDRGGRFAIMRLPTMTTVASWVEHPVPGRFTTGVFHGRPAIFYLKDDAVVVRSAAGALLAALSAPGVAPFRDIDVAEIRGQYLIVMASGDGYTPYHMVMVFRESGELAYQRTAAEHAFKLEIVAGQPAFEVWSRSTRWRYWIPAPMIAR